MQKISPLVLDKPSDDSRIRIDGDDTTFCFKLMNKSFETLRQSYAELTGIKILLQKKIMTFESDLWILNREEHCVAL